MLPRLVLDLVGVQPDLDRSYDDRAFVASDRPMPTSVGYRLGGEGPVGAVGYSVFHGASPPDSHDVNAAAGASRFGVPDGVMGASLSYSFR